MRGLEVVRNKSHSNRAPREKKVNIEAGRQALWPWIFSVNKTGSPVSLGAGWPSVLCGRDGIASESQCQAGVKEGGDAHSKPLVLPGNSLGNTVQSLRGGACGDVLAPKMTLRSVPIR